jgi:succinate dehydrogenase/fumarate reductase flavoprotein subunit
VERFFSEHGLDLGSSELILAPEAHFLMGGVAIDPDGRTSLPGLFAAGEVSGGVDGGNRLDSNAIPAGQVFGRRAGISASACARDRGTPRADPELRARWETRLRGLRQTNRGGMDPKKVKGQIRGAMLSAAGILRTGERLGRGREVASELHEELRGGRPPEARDVPAFLEAENMALVSLLVCSAASFRTESRAAHFREDFPAQDDGQWRLHAALIKGENDRICLAKEPSR